MDGELAEDTERTFEVLSFIVALKMEPMTLCILGNHSVTEPCSQSRSVLSKACGEEAPP